MLTGLYTKLIGLGLILAALAGLFLWGHHVGAANVQTRWDAAKTAQIAAVDRQAAVSVLQSATWLHQFDTIATHYEASAHETAPAVADSVSAAVRAGTLRLSGERASDRCLGQVSDITARSRAIDAAATQALADRTAAAIRIIRIGDAADARERQLREQLTALQDVLRAERAPAPALP